MQKLEQHQTLQSINKNSILWHTRHLGLHSNSR